MSRNLYPNIPDPTTRLVVEDLARQVDLLLTRGAAKGVAPGSIVRGMVYPGAIGTLELADRSVTEPKLADGAVSTRSAADGFLSADAAGRAKMADEYVTLAKLVVGILSADAAGRSRMADEYVVLTKLAIGILSADAAGRSRMADAFITTAKLIDGVLSADAAGRAKMADGYLSPDATGRAKMGDFFVNLAKLSGEVTRYFPGTPTITVGPEVSNVRNVAVQMRDVTGAVVLGPLALQVWLSSTPAGPKSTTLLKSYSNGTQGTIITPYSDDAGGNTETHWWIMTNTTGAFNINLEQNLVRNYYLNVEHHGLVHTSPVIEFT